MAADSKIEWTDKTWSPVIGCDRVSPGCDGCYAIGTARIRESNPHPAIAAAFAGTTERTADGIDWSGTVNLLEDRLTQPLRWRKARRVFVNSMSDLFHDAIPDAFIARIFAIMAATSRHTYQVLTKRHGRMRSLLRSDAFRLLVKEAYAGLKLDGLIPHAPLVINVWPLPNVLLGVSVENQKWAEIRIPALLETPAALRFLSCEPLLGPIDLKRAVWTMGLETHPGLIAGFVHGGRCCERFHGIDWVITGGESGHKARPAHPDWFRSIRDQCQAGGIPYFHKQNGEWLTATVRDDPQFAGGRVFDDPRGSRCAPVVRERGPSGTFRTATTRLLRPGETVGRLSMLDADTVAVRVGTAAAGRELDGSTWDQFPEVAPC